MFGVFIIYRVCFGVRVVVVDDENYVDFVIYDRFYDFFYVFIVFVGFKCRFIDVVNVFYYFFV